MKRVFLVLTIVAILLAACMPSAFCVAETDNVTRFGQLLDALDAVDNYADLAVSDKIAEAEALLTDPDVVAAYSDEQRAMVSEYRRRFDRDSMLAEIAVRVQSSTHSVRLSADDVRRYDEREWAQIATWQATLEENVAVAVDSDAMQALWQEFLDSVRGLPVSDEVYDAWEITINEVVCGYIDQLYQKVNAYRLSQNLGALSGPVFFLAGAEEFVQSFAAFAAANLENGNPVSLAFEQALDSTISLGHYASEAQMNAQWNEYSQAVTEAVPTISAQDLALHNAIEEAVATLRTAIDNSKYVQSLSGTDAELYMGLPEIMRTALLQATTVEEVQAVLDDYMSLLDPSAMESKKDAGLNTLTVMIIVSASLTVLLFIAYFILKWRNGKTSTASKKDGDMVLAEMMAMTKRQDATGSATPTTAPRATDDDAPFAHTPTYNLDTGEYNADPFGRTVQDEDKVIEAARRAGELDTTDVQPAEEDIGFYSPEDAEISIEGDAVEESEQTGQESERDENVSADTDDNGGEQ